MVNTHFRHGLIGLTSRVRGADLVCERAGVLQRRHDAAAIVITGDFNCNPTEEPYSVFRDHGFRDTFLEAGHVDGAVSTFHAFLGIDYDPRSFGGERFWRIDWILVRDGRCSVQVEHVEIVRSHVLATYPSDHYPVIAEMTLTRRE